MNKNTPEPFFDFSEVAGIMHPGCRICGKAIFAVDACEGHDEHGFLGPDEDYLIGEDADRMVKAMKEDA